MSKDKKQEVQTSGKVFYVTRHFKYDTMHADSKYKGMAESEWVEMMKQLAEKACNTGNIEFLAGIFHDRDIEDKKPVMIHFHMLMRFKKVTEQPDVRSFFGATSDKNCKVPDSKLGMARYLTHTSEQAIEDEKTVYRDDEIMCWNVRYKDLKKASFWESKKTKNELKLVSKRDKAEAIADGLGKQIRDGEIRVDKAKELLEEQAGYAWVRKLGHTFEIDRQAFIERRVREMIADGRNNRNIYIMGSGGSGKSSLAQDFLGLRIADEKGLYPATVSGISKTPDPLNKYVDEKVAVFNEMNPSSWDLNEFNSVFDPKKYGSFPSRNENKDFVGDTCIFANSISPLRFAKDLVVYTKGGSKYQDPVNEREIDSANWEAVDKYWQVRRRMKNIMVLERDAQDPTIVHCHVFNLRTGVMNDDGSKSLNDGTHILVGSIDFISVPDEKPVFADNVLDELERLIDVDVSGAYRDVTTIDGFLEENGMLEEPKDTLMSSFVEDVVNNCVWNLLPTTFLYDIYKEYRKMYYPSDELLNIQKFTGRLDVMLDDWERKQDVRSSGKMDADEPLISVYGLDRVERNGKPTPWMSSYNGGNSQKTRDFRRQLKYKGFVRK